MIFTCTGADKETTILPPDGLVTIADCSDAKKELDKAILTKFLFRYCVGQVSTAASMLSSL